MPGPQTVSSVSNQGSQEESAKFSYYVYFLPDLNNKMKQGSIEEALRDSFSGYGISDVIKSEKVEHDRINVFVYEFGEEERMASIIEGPWFLLSVATLGIVPFYYKPIDPIEIHIITPSRQYDKQIKVIHNEQVTAQWMWLPFLFMPNDETKEDALYRPDYEMKLHYVALRRIFNGVILEALRD